MSRSLDFFQTADEFVCLASVGQVFLTESRGAKKEEVVVVVVEEASSIFVDFSPSWRHWQ